MTMKKQLENKKLKKPNRKFIIGGAVLLALGGIGYTAYWYYNKEETGNASFVKRKQSKQPTISASVVNTGNTVSGFCRSTSYPLGKHTCHKDVGVLQFYLKKKHNASLGNTGRNRDGVDNMFGSKTLAALKKYYKKQQATQKDMDWVKADIKRRGWA